MDSYQRLYSIKKRLNFLSFAILEAMKKLYKWDLYNTPFLISSTTSGLSKVEISPKFSPSLEAIFLKILLIILPDLVLGRPETN